MNKKFFTECEAEIIELEADVITSSSAIDGDNGDDGTIDPFFDTNVLGPID